MRLPQSTLSSGAMIAGGAILAISTLTYQSELGAAVMATIGVALLLTSWRLGAKSAELAEWQEDYFDSSPDGMILIDEPTEKVVRINVKP